MTAACASPSAGSTGKHTPHCMAVQHSKAQHSLTYGQCIHVGLVDERARRRQRIRAAAADGDDSIMWLQHIAVASDLQRLMPVCHHQRGLQAGKGGRGKSRKRRLSDRRDGGDAVGARRGHISRQATPPAAAACCSKCCPMTQQATFESGGSRSHPASSGIYPSATSCTAPQRPCIHMRRGGGLSMARQLAPLQHDFDCSNGLQQGSARIWWLALQYTAHNPNTCSQAHARRAWSAAQSAPQSCFPGAQTG